MIGDALVCAKPFHANNLGSLVPGKYADLLVLDRDYLNVPADEIKDLNPVMTMVGGKVVYSEGAITKKSRRRSIKTNLLTIVPCAAKHLDDFFIL